jgi:hypothetical protein
MVWMKSPREQVQVEGKVQGLSPFTAMLTDWGDKVEVKEETEKDWVLGN